MCPYATFNGKLNNYRYLSQTKNFETHKYMLNIVEHLQKNINCYLQCYTLKYLL